MKSLSEKIKVTAAFLKEKGMTEPEFGLILGSGLGELAEEIENAVSLDYADIPNWGRSTVVGHAGKLVYGDLAGRKVLALQGRFHFYEGNEGSWCDRCYCDKCSWWYRLWSWYAYGHH